MYGKALETIAFFDLFDWPLTENEFFNLTRVNPASLPSAIEKEDIFLFLKGRRELIQLRRAREKQAAIFWRKVRGFISWLALLPFVRAVFVANKLAYNNVEARSDIDLLIVIERNRLWFTRLLVSLWLLVLGQKRQGERTAGRFCLSFFVTSNALDFSQVKIVGSDPYLVYWSYLLTPVFDYGIAPKLVADNAWLKERFPWFGISNLPAPITRVNGLMRVAQFIGETIFYILLGPLWEVLLKQIQLARIEVRRKLPAPGEVISDSMLKFHPEDKREQIKEKLAAKLATLQ